MPDKPLILAFDTSAAHCAAALLLGDELLESAFEQMTKGQAERLLPMCNEVMAKAGKSLQDLNAIGVGVGPGNFTGIRVAVSAARGLALGLGVPAVGITSFEALAFGAETPCITTVDARRGRIYVQGFGLSDWQDPQEMDAAELPQDIPVISQGAYPLTEAIARLTAARFADANERPAPFYLRPADAAPARDAPPTILT